MIFNWRHAEPSGTQQFHMADCGLVARLRTGRRGTFNPRSFSRCAAVSARTNRGLIITTSDFSKGVEAGGGTRGRNAGWPDERRTTRRPASRKRNRRPPHPTSVDSTGGESPGHKGNDRMTIREQVVSLEPESSSLSLPNPAGSGSHCERRDRQKGHEQDRTC